MIEYNQCGDAAEMVWIIISTNMPREQLRTHKSNQMHIARKKLKVRPFGQWSSLFQPPPINQRIGQKRLRRFAKTTVRSINTTFRLIDRMDETRAPTQDDGVV